MNSRKIKRYEGIVFLPNAVCNQFRIDLITILFQYYTAFLELFLAGAVVFFLKLLSFTPYTSLHGFSDHRFWD